jgi:cytoskeleton protein RodZ
MTIGERLEEARKRKGVSIREAAEATKIRGDFLLSMENNSFDINLPEIYVRGFLKNYARFLKVDPARILIDYEAYRLGSRPPGERLARGGAGSAASRHPETHSAHRHGESPDPSGYETEEPERRPTITSTRPSFGRMEIPAPAASAENADRAPSEEHAAAKDREPADPQKTAEESSYNDYGADKSLYIKIGVIFAAVFAVGFLIVVLVSVLRSGGNGPEINPDLADRSSSAAGGAAAEASTTSRPAPERTPEPAGNSLRPETVTLRALGTVTVIVEQSIDRQRLFQGNLTNGQTQTFEAVGPVIVRYSSGDNLVVERRGESYRMGKSGVGFNTVR